MCLVDPIGTTWFGGMFGVGVNFFYLEKRWWVSDYIFSLFLMMAVPAEVSLPIVCPLCDNDPALRNIKERLTVTARLLVDTWNDAYSLQVFNGETFDEYLVCRNVHATLTVIPTLEVYLTGWDSEMWVSPLGFKWMSFDLHEHFDTAYLDKVVSVTSSQYDLWNIDGTNYHPVFLLFGTLLKLLKKLQSYAEY